MAHLNHTKFGLNYGGGNMKQRHILKTLLVLFFGLTSTVSIALTFSQATNCEEGNVCWIDVPGTKCANGEQSGYSVAPKKDSQGLMIFLMGGGACWDKETCDSKVAKLALEPFMKYEGPYEKQKDNFSRGWGDIDNRNNPFVNFDLVRVPYCTGDVHTGNRTADHGTADDPYVLHHVGHQNFKLILDELSRLYSSPEKILFIGTSAGGLGVTWNLFEMKSAYPLTPTYVVNDSGLPFKHPFASKDKLIEIYNTWGADLDSPISIQKPEDSVESPFSQIIRYNQEKFPQTYYGFISGYQDLVMSLFLRLLDAPNYLVGVKQTMVGLAEEEFAQSDYSKVFYVEDWWHSYAIKDPYQIVSMGTRLSEWLGSMINRNLNLPEPVGDSDKWVNVRPDRFLQN